MPMREASIDSGQIMGAVIAGGQSSRMGSQDKLAVELGTQTLVARALERLRAQIADVVVNLPRSKSSLLPAGCPVVPDEFDDLRGPLAGISAVLNDAATKHPERTHVVTVAADTPFFPADLADRLTNAITTDASIAIATGEGYPQPLFGCWPVSLGGDLQAFLHAGETYKVMAFARRYDLTLVDFGESQGTHSPFFNINTPEDLALAENLIRQDAR
jgi:molybdopterin-guanine dinucleotide biosynthesis protein A